MVCSIEKADKMSTEVPAGSNGPEGADLEETKVKSSLVGVPVEIVSQHRRSELVQVL